MKRKFDHIILLLQGGGALGAYQAGLYEGLAEAGIEPTWVVGVSIGAVNSALIVGNPPERRIERLRAWWDRVSSYAPFAPFEWAMPMRPMYNQMSAATVAMYGVPGFFKPRFPHPSFAPAGSPQALSIYDTEEMKGTLEELVDFDRINRHEIRLSLGAVNIRTGFSTYFDNLHTSIGPDHVRASGALPPGFPPVEIDGEYYFDGGLVSNSPMTYVVDEKPRKTMLVIQADLFNVPGELPANLEQVQELTKDIQYQSKQRFNVERTRELTELRAAVGRLLGKLPAELKGDPDAQMIAPYCDAAIEWDIVRLVNRRRVFHGDTKDYEFSRATVNERWNAGLEDVRTAVANAEWMKSIDLGPGLRIYDATAKVQPAKTPASPDKAAATSAD